MVAGNNGCSSQPLTEEASTANHHPLMVPGSNALHAPPDAFPIDLIAEILVRLPVKPLLRFRCVCKSWNALISDPRFAKQQLHRASASNPNRHHLIVTSFDPPSLRSLLVDYSLRSVFNSSCPLSYSHRSHPFKVEPNSSYLFGSCDGMLCLAVAAERIDLLVWNPSTGKFKNLPSVNWQDPHRATTMLYGFGYDHSSGSETYKVAAGLIFGSETYVQVHTLGTDSWRTIQKFPAPFVARVVGCGVFVNGALNWLVKYDESPHLAIVSLDLGTETYQQLLPPDDCLAHVPNHNVDFTLTTNVLKGCLCIFAHYVEFADLWVMKDYGKKESWTKLLCVPNRIPCVEGIRRHYKISSPLCVSDEYDEILLQTYERPVYHIGRGRLKKYESNLLVYSSKSGTSKNPRIKKLGDRITAVYAESLISPCF